ncbi:hypothetical protein LshimejAT787_0308620 [Lyophyllum shimeji]|uniref:Uncharacterized protein n=1 Tax=Lyophyllum shimeji TaxID=47721 RepID=A0A9P3PJG5_LYOSH|nr:hypothetical protein LshimejAT787_0308620 [Lyophyllum shimeji]
MSLDERDLIDHCPFLTTKPVARRVATARSSFPSQTRTSYSRRRHRPSPYPQPQRSLHQLHITHLDPASVQELIEIVRPPSPRHALAAVLNRPQRGLQNHNFEWNGEVERRPVHRMFAMLTNVVQAVKHAILRV